jgi:acetyl esterase/lipase
MLIVLLFMSTFVTTNAQNIPLYQEGKVPGAKISAILADTLYYMKDGKQLKFVQKRTLIPSIEVFQPKPERNTGIAVLVCSGGSYSAVADYAEGYPAAKKLASAGINVFVLHYRLPKPDMMDHKEIGPLQDAQRALQYIKENAKTWSIDTAKVGIMGFSAGGHLASTVATHYNKNYIPNPGLINLRPAFLVLAYPVISFADSITHMPSRQQLIGPDITNEKIEEFSNELHISPQSPPTFITHALDDKEVKIDNSILFIAALNKNHVPVECFFYAKGGHGYGINNKTSDVQWIDECIKWLRKAAP